MFRSNFVLKCFESSRANCFSARRSDLQQFSHSKTSSRVEFDRIGSDRLSLRKLLGGEDLTRTVYTDAPIENADCLLFLAPNMAKVRIFGASPARTVLQALADLIKRSVFMGVRNDKNNTYFGRKSPRRYRSRSPPIAYRSPGRDPRRTRKSYRSLLKPQS